MVLGCFFNLSSKADPWNLMHITSFLKDCLFCKRVANLVKQDRNIFPSAIVGRLEKCVQETWAMTKSECHN